MTTQITVRLPDETVAFVDKLVASGQERSRATAVAHALWRERERRLDERDATIYADEGEVPDLEEFISYTAPRIDLGELD
jgi:Arc/MetJ-type ribon-helix-helix transcriptional regulator